MKQKQIIILIAILVLSGIGFVIFSSSRHSKSTSSQSSQQTPSPLAVNTIPVTQRPFATLTPDTSGHNLFFYLDRPHTQATIEYELVYTAGNKEEGAFGHLNLSQEKLPITKKILLGSKSAGGAVTYHEGITGGYLTLTYDQVKLKEDFNFLHFDPQNQDGYSSVDARFTAYFGPKQLSPNAVILIMKSFGLPKDLPQGKVVAGPYYIGTAKNIAPQKIEIKVSANQPVLYEYIKGEWTKLEADYQDKTFTATPSSNLFIVVE